MAKNNNNHLFSLLVSLDQVFGKGLAEGFSVRLQPDVSWGCRHLRERGWLFPMAGRLVLAVGRRPWVFSTWVPPHACLSVFMVWWLALPAASIPGGQGGHCKDILT